MHHTKQVTSIGNIPCLVLFFDKKMGKFSPFHTYDAEIMWTLMFPAVCSYVNAHLTTWNVIYFLALASC